MMNQEIPTSSLDSTTKSLVGLRQAVLPSSTICIMGMMILAYTLWDNCKDNNRLMHLNTQKHNTIAR